MIECCANSIQSALNGEQGGGTRIELCTKLELGGITPKRKDILKTKKALTIPICILIRPRSGDFIYSQDELSQMFSDIQFCKTVGCERIAIGALKKDGSINMKQTKQMVRAAMPMRVTFHRAFDEGNDLQKNLEDVIACGCDTLLTAGQSKNVNSGISNLKKLIKLAKERIAILAGSGVNHTNVEALYKIGIRNFHLSGSTKYLKDELKTDPVLIKKMKNKLDQIA